MNILDGTFKAYLTGGGESFVKHFACKVSTSSLKLCFYF